MPGASEALEFRRAFIWLLCAVLLPSVALVAFGVVAVANEKAAVELRLSEEYGARLDTLAAAIDTRLAEAAHNLLEGRPDPALDKSQVLPDPPNAEGALASVSAKAALLPLGGFLTVPADASAGLPAPLLVVRTAQGAREFSRAAPIDVEAIAAEVPQMAARAFPRERAHFRLRLPEHGDALSTFRRLAAQAQDRAAVIATLPLPPPLQSTILVAELPGNDPAANLAFRNRLLYVLMLGLLYTSIGVGFGLTLRELRRGARISQLKTDFVANISHELRTPLTSVRLFAETLLSGRASNRQEEEECLQLLASEATRLSTLVEKLLDWSRLESGRRQLLRELVEPRTLIEQVGEIFRAQQLGVAYETEVAEGLPRIRVDREALSQAVLNLLYNAVKYTGPDKRICLRARKEKRRVAIEVQDNGVGVRHFDRKRIFDRFYRADDLLSRKTEGTGLGLAIAKRIVEMHGGRIDLESEEGVGSTFRILLPAEEPA